MIEVFETIKTFFKESTDLLLVIGTFLFVLLAVSRSLFSRARSSGDEGKGGQA